MEVRRYIAILGRRRWLIVLSIAIAAAGAWVTTDRTAVYTARATVYVGASRFTVEDGDPNLSGDIGAGLNRLLTTYALMIDAEPVASRALELTGLNRSPEQVVGQTDVTTDDTSTLIVIEVSDPDPTVAQTLANGMANAFIAKVDDLEPGQQVGEGDLPFTNATVFERAALPTVPVPIGLLRSIVVAAAFGLALSAGAVLLVDYLDVTVKDAIDVEGRLGLPVLAVIPMVAMGQMVLPARRSARERDLNVVADA